MHFAAVVGYVPPHCPFVAPEDLFDYYYDRVNVPTQPTADEQPAASRMIHRGRWKLHKYADDTPPVLFDLEADPRELDDCGGDPDLAELRQQLLRVLFEGWDPDFVRRDSERQVADMQLLSAWEEAVKPAHEDTLSVPHGADGHTCSAAGLCAISGKVGGVAGPGQSAQYPVLAPSSGGARWQFRTNPQQRR